MKPTLTLLFLGAILVACEEVPAGPHADGEVLFADDFDPENGEEGELNYDAFAHWDVVEGSVDLIGNGLYDFVPDNGLYVDLDGTTSDAGTLVTKRGFDLFPGIYKIDVEVAGPQVGQNDTITVSLGDLFVEDIWVPEAEPQTTLHRRIHVEEATTVDIEIGASGSDNEGILLFSVRLSRVGNR